MPAAAGAVAAAAIADQMLGPKEDRKLAIVLVLYLLHLLHELIIFYYKFLGYILYTCSVETLFSVPLCT